MLRPLALAALIVSPAVPAAAAGSELVDAETIKACLDGAGPDPAGCIGEIADPCQDEPGGATTMGIDGCLLREHAAWDVILNETYRAAMSTAQQQDAIYEQSGVEPTAADSLREAQRAWVAFRDAECDRLYDLYKDGTVRSNVASACLLDLTARRAIDFLGE